MNRIHYHYTIDYQRQFHIFVFKVRRTAHVHLHIRHMPTIHLSLNPPPLINLWGYNFIVLSLLVFLKITFRIWFAISRCSIKLLFDTPEMTSYFFLSSFSQKLCVQEARFFGHFSCALSQDSRSANFERWYPNALYINHKFVLLLSLE